MAGKKTETPEESEAGDEVPVEEGEMTDEDEELAPLARSPDFFKAYATRTVSHLTEFDIRVVIANETMGDEEGWCTITDGMVILTPLAAKELAAELDDLVRAWEELHGRIVGRKGRRIVTTFSREEG